MNYKKHYELLIEKSKDRKIEGYKEKHHIVPRCMGGNAGDNLVDLTPEEHYLAHLLLIKIYPNNQKLIYAANMMTVGNKFAQRTNKLYGWLRRKHSLVAKQRTGKKNGSYGRYWYHDPLTLNSGKFKNKPEGWMSGRTPNTKCIICNNDTGSKKRKYCDMHRPKPKSPSENGYIPTKKHADKIRDYCLSRPKEKHPQFGKKWINDGSINRMIDKEDVDINISSGWNLGKIKT